MLTPNPMIDRISERATDVAAMGAVSSPWWLPSLSVTSEVAGQLLPIAGLIWLGVQSYVRLRHRR